MQTLSILVVSSLGKQLQFISTKEVELMAHSSTIV